MSGKPGGYVGQDFGELSRAAVLERCCLQKRRVYPIRNAFPELHRRSGFEAPLKGRPNKH
jgi:hypothetical protein